MFKTNLIGAGGLMVTTACIALGAGAAPLPAPRPAPPIYRLPVVALVVPGRVAISVQSRRGPSLGQRQAHALVAQHRRFTVQDLTPGSGPSPLLTYIQSSLRGDQPYNLSGSAGSGQQVLENFGRNDITALAANAVALFPGSLVQGRDSFIQSGQLDPIGINAAAGKITITGGQFQNRNAAVTAPVSSASNSAVETALQGLVTQPWVPDQAGLNSCNLDIVQSSSQAALAVGASASYIGYGSIKDTFSTTDSRSSNHVVIYCEQQYYTAAYTPDNRNGYNNLDAYFAPGLDINVAKRAFGPSNPPLVISSVTYGSQLFIEADSTEDAQTMKNDLNVAVGAFGVGGTGSIDVQTASRLNNVTIRIKAIGARASAQTAVISAGTPGGVAQGLKTYLANSIDFSSAGGVAREVGLPISYTLSYLDGVMVAEQGAAYGSPVSVGPQIDTLVGASLHFHGNGDGKDCDTTVDLGLSDPGGNRVAYTHLPAGYCFSDNGDTQEIPLNIENTSISRDIIQRGYFDINISTVGNDTWNYTAYLTLRFKSSPPLGGQLRDSVSDSNTHHHTNLCQFFVGKGNGGCQ